MFDTVKYVDKRLCHKEPWFLPEKPAESLLNEAAELCCSSGSTAAFASAARLSALAYCCLEPCLSTKAGTFKHCFLLENDCSMYWYAIITMGTWVLRSDHGSTSSKVQRNEWLQRFHKKYLILGFHDIYQIVVHKSSVLHNSFLAWETYQQLLIKGFDYVHKLEPNLVLMC